MDYFGIKLEEKRNLANDGIISAAESRVVVRVIHTDEELMIARSVRSILGLGMNGKSEVPNHISK